MTRTVGSAWFPGMTPLDDEQRRLVEANVGLVRFAVGRFRHRADDDDAYQSGTFGLMRAAQTFDPAKGFAFSTYAMGWIRRAIGNGDRIELGRNYRKALDTGTAFDAPSSTDAEVGDGLTLADLLGEDLDYAAVVADGEALDALRTEISRLSDIDRACLLERTPAAAKRFGITAAAAHMRRVRTTRRLVADLAHLREAG